VWKNHPLERGFWSPKKRGAPHPKLQGGWGSSPEEEGDKPQKRMGPPHTGPEDGSKTTHTNPLRGPGGNTLGETLPGERGSLTRPPEKYSEEKGGYQNKIPEGFKRKVPPKGLISLPTGPKGRGLKVQPQPLLKGKVPTGNPAREVRERFSP